MLHISSYSSLAIPASCSLVLNNSYESGLRTVDTMYPCFFRIMLSPFASESESNSVFRVAINAFDKSGSYVISPAEDHLRFPFQIARCL